MLKLTKHSLQRANRRAGMTKKQAKQSAVKAWKFGRIIQIQKDILCTSRKVLYSGYIYIFKGTRLITVYKNEFHKEDSHGKRSGGIQAGV